MEEKSSCPETEDSVKTETNEFDEQKLPISKGGYDENAKMAQNATSEDSDNQVTNSENLGNETYNTMTSDGDQIDKQAMRQREAEKCRNHNLQNTSGITSPSELIDESHRAEKSVTESSVETKPEQNFSELAKFPAETASDTTSADVTNNPDDVIKYETHKARDLADDVIRQSADDVIKPENDVITTLTNEMPGITKDGEFEIARDEDESNKEEKETESSRDSQSVLQLVENSVSAVS